MKFRKMHGIGNDFVILDHRNGEQALDFAKIRHICNRQTGIGCDQLIIIEPSQRADLFMRIYNPDGSQAESCGNATRCVAHLYMSESRKKACTIETLGGLLSCRLVGDLVEVDMGSPQLEWQDIPLAKKTDTLNLGIGEGPAQNPVAVSMGNPHCVFFVDRPEDIPVETLGPIFEHHKLFPRRTNVEFAHITSEGNIRLRVWERGAGVTLACGSGACATIVAAIRRGLTGRKADIVMDGGTLQLEWRESDSHVLMTGPVAYVFEGEMQ